MTAFSFHFTKSRLARLSYAQTRSQIYRDTDVRGLRLKVGKRRKTFNFVKRIKGSFNSPVTLTLGTFPSMTIEDARREQTISPTSVNRASILGGNSNEKVATRRFSLRMPLINFWRSSALK